MLSELQTPYKLSTRMKLVRVKAGMHAGKWLHQGQGIIGHAWQMWARSAQLVSGEWQGTDMEKGPVPTVGV